MKQLTIWVFLSTTLLLGINKVALTQTTETFETTAGGVSSFTSNGVSFTLHPNGNFAINASFAGYGYGSSNRFVDNYGIANTSFQIKSATSFTAKSLYLYPSTNAEGSSNQTVGVSVTFTGKLAGATKFTYSPPASDFTAASYENTSNRGFTLIDFASPGYSNIAIDELEISLGGSAIYCGIDNFTWGGITSNNSPTNIALSASSINENVAANTTVGSLSSTDPDSGNTFTYTLVAGSGDTDNASFNISGSNLRISQSPDYEAKSSYSVRVRTTDQGSLTYEKTFSISVNNLNETPTNIALSASSINENVGANTTVGSLSSTDPDSGNTFTYTLVAGAGDTDNASFNISGSNLRISISPDFETKSSYSVRVRTTDQGSLTYEKTFSISVSNLNETPTNIALSASSINENVAANTTVGSLSSTDPDSGNTFTYTLVAGSGDTDNASFNISGSNLRISQSPDYEAKSSYSVRVRTTDQGSLTYEKTFSISVNNLNETPTNIALSASSINENVGANTTVGSLSSTDPDSGNTFTYTLVAGAGDTDNASFNISGSNLRISISPDYETKSSYSVRVRTTDQGSLTYEKTFTITILFVNSNNSPTDISLSATSINENVAANTTVGSLSSTDPDSGNTFTYTLVAGVGDTDNASFNISGSNLRISISPDFETKSSYSVRVRTTDQGSLTYEKTFSISVNNLNETPTNIALSASSINENVAANTTVGSLSSTDPDSGNTFTYTLVAGAGDTDNASFNISGSNLRISISPDYETKSSYSVRVRTTDQGSLTYEKTFTITILFVNSNNSPTDISLSATSINENVAANTTVGSLSSTDPDSGNTFTYNLVAGAGDTDNASFNISGSNLRISISPDFETKSSYSVRVRTTDQGSLTFEKTFTITILYNNVNSSPTDIALSASSINENVAANSTVGSLSSTDPDSGNTFTYALVAGSGDTDNASFNISGANLRITNIPDFESKSSYSVRVRTTDQGSLTYEKTFSISVNNLNETPTNIALSASSINENVAANTTVGSLSSTDPDSGNTFTYTLVTGAGDTDNASFNISGSNLRISISPDFETKSSYSVRVRTTDQGSLTYEKTFSISVSNLNETPTNIALSASSINENVAANSTVGSLSSTDPDSGNTFSYTLVAGASDTDNASFNISGSNLRISISPDFETKSSYSVRVRTTDQGSLTYEKTFNIQIIDVFEVVPPRIAGDLNGDGKITAPEIAGDVNGNGIIDSNEKTGDTNGDGKIAPPELLGDSNGNGIIDNGEISGFDLPENDDKLSAYAIRNTEIRITGEVTGKAVASLIDIQGRTVLIKNLEAGNLNLVPISSIKTGIYFIRVKDLERIQMIKITVNE